MDLRVFVDSDVVISSLISSKGAAYHLINETHIKRFISNKSIAEIKRVAKELNIDGARLSETLEKNFSKVELKDSLVKIKEKYGEYTSDQHDTHITAGAHAAKVKFLISYNLKDFRAEEINEDFNIILMTPARFLQYLRSLK